MNQPQSSPIEAQSSPVKLGLPTYLVTYLTIKRMN